MSRNVMNATVAAMVVMMGGLDAGAELSANAYVTNGLVALYDGIENAGVGVHDETVRAWADLSGHGYDGTLGANVTWEANGWTNGQDGYPVTVGSALAAVTGTKNFTLEFAVRPSRSASREAFFGQYDGAQGFNVEHNSYDSFSGNLRVFASNNPSWVSPSVLAQDEDATIALTFTTERQALYRNGAADSARDGSAGGFMSTTTSSVIGGEPTRANMAFRGVYHAFRLYDRPLTADEIAINAAIDAVRFRGVAPGAVTLPDGYAFNGDGDLCVRVRAVALEGGTVAVADGESGLTNNVLLQVNAGGTASFTATADEGCTFVEWLGDLDAIVEGDAQSPTVTVAERGYPLTLWARFRTSASRSVGTSAYVRNGLVMFFDGIDNAGSGEHDDAATRWADLSGNGNDGVVASGIVWTDNAWQNNANGRPIALAKGGAGKAAAAAIANKNFTVEFTAKPSRDNVREVFFGEYNGRYGFNIEHNSSSGNMDGHIRVYYSGNPDLNIAAVCVKRDECANISLASAANEQIVYKNGSLCISHNFSITGTLDADCDCYVGGEPSRDGMAFRGDYHAFRLYNRMLSAAEIEQNALLDGVRYQGKACTFWTKAGAGNWLDVSPWTRGVPDVDMPAAIIEPAESIDVDVVTSVPATTNLLLANERGLTTVHVREGGVLPLSRARLTVGKGARLVVHDGGTVNIDETNTAWELFDQIIKPIDGGQILVDGGQMTISGVDSSFIVPSGSEGCTGRLTVASGRLDLTNMGEYARLRAHAGGRIEVCGDGQVNLFYSEPNATEASINYGGTLEISGNGVYTVTNRMVAANSGLIHLKDSGKLQINRLMDGNGNLMGRLGISPADEPAVVTVDDDAEIAFDVDNVFVYICNNHAGLRGVLNWNSSKTFSSKASFAVGFINGEGVLNVTRGTVQGGGYGLRIAQNAGTAMAGATARGIANVSGGCLLNCNNSWQNTETLQGLVVGAGVPAVLSNPGWLHGTLNVSGGAVTNMAGGASYFAVGVGYARGEVVQTGGTIANAQTTYPTVIGAFGGTGEWIVTNGVSFSGSDVYVGGITTNAMPNKPVDLYKVARVDAGCATGTLDVVGGTFTAQRAIHAGHDGAAKLAVGPTGRLEAASADLAHTEVAFTCGPTGVGTFDVAGALALGADVRLTVDTRAYVEGDRALYRILGCASSTGEFAEISVKGRGQIRRLNDGYWLDMNRGLVIIIR